LQFPAHGEGSAVFYPRKLHQRGLDRTVVSADD